MSVSPEQIEDDYIVRTIATVRNHREADNCWPQWANSFADEIERCWAALREARDENERLLDGIGEISVSLDGWAGDALRALAVSPPADEAKP